MRYFSNPFLIQAYVQKHIHILAIIGFWSAQNSGADLVEYYVMVLILASKY